MKLKGIIAVIGLALSQAAAADFEIKTVVEAIEASPSNIILPASTSGMMTYRACYDECDREYERARLTEKTVFSVNGKVVKFEDFRAKYAEARRTDKALALVSVHLESRTITKIDITR